MKEEQGQQQDEKPRIFGLKHEDEKRLHPYALRRLEDWRAEIFKEVPQLERLTIDEINADINTNLNDEEQARANRYRNNIIEWLRQCMDIGNGFSLSPYATWVVSSMFELKWLTKTAYKRKQERAEEGEKKREEARRWKEAVSYVFPLQLWKDADRYLNDDERKKLLDVIVIAARAYLKEGDGYLDNYKTYEYRWWLREISYRKEKEQIYLDAEAQAGAFSVKLDQWLGEFKSKLIPEAEDPVEIFKRCCSSEEEARYLGESFTDILDSDNDRKYNWTQGYVHAAEERLQKWIPEKYRDFILTKPTAVFFLLPSANYSNRGIPCLDFYFDVFAVVTLTVSAHEGPKVFNGYKFKFLINLQEPELLGYYQIIITPNKPRFWQSVPLIIIHALMDGILEPPKVIILNRTDLVTVYKVKKFEEDICEIPLSFEKYFHSLGSVKKMEELGIIKKRTAEILGLPQPIINQKETSSKKTKAFELFSEGKRPSDLDVKSLGIKPESAYRYYQEWKKTHGNSNSHP